MLSTTTARRRRRGGDQGRLRPTENDGHIPVRPGAGSLAATRLRAGAFCAPRLARPAPRAGMMWDVPPRPGKCPTCRSQYVEFTRYEEDRRPGVTVIDLSWECGCGASGSEHRERGAPNPIVEIDRE